jgi:hypothetical protein
MNRPFSTCRSALWIAAAAVAAGALSAPARAEYRCTTPERLSNAETRACELAQQDTPNALIHFVNRTKGIYDLYVNDYVSKADVERWELAKHKGEADSPTVAKAGSNMNDVSKGH